METSKRTIGEVEIAIHTVNTIVIGAGVAGLNAAEHLHSLGIEDVVIVTDDVGGSSAASGKNTYYRMGMMWARPDSPLDFVKALVDPGMTHGDNAYIEAVNSIPEFLHIVRNGVRFPKNEFGEFTGEGDHNRATSAGPHTSKIMAEKALDSVRQRRIQILPKHVVVALLTAGEGDSRHVIGALAVDTRKAAKPSESLVLFNCKNIVLATGSLAELFGNRLSSGGSASGHGLALKSGAALANATETRFGLAFAKSRVRLEGVYQRVIPNYYSLGKGGRDQRYFLAEYFHATKQIASAIFFKGEHWPFSMARLQSMGPSVIDIAVYNEMAAGRRVFVDFTKNIKGENIGQFNISQLDPTAREYLEKHNAIQFTPFDRLRHLDASAIDRMVDLKTDLREPQEVTISAEDMFAGIAVSKNWETRVPHLFAVGEVASTHSNPPSGAGLNAGQVGGLRAAEFIAANYKDAPVSLDNFLAAVRTQLDAEVANILRYQYGPIEAPTIKAIRADIAKRTDGVAGMVRGVSTINQALEGARKMYEGMKTAGQRLSRAAEFSIAVENELLGLTQMAVLEGIKSYIERGGGSRGAYLVLDERGDGTILTRRGSELRHRNENMGLRDNVLEVRLKDKDQFEVVAVPVRPIPKA